MILHYSTNNFSYQLEGGLFRIRKCQKGFYVDANPQIFFDNFIFTSVDNTHYLITTSRNDFIVYKVTDKIETAIIIDSPQSLHTSRLFEYVILKFDKTYVKITPNLNFTTISRPDDIDLKTLFPAKESMEFFGCDITLKLNIPILYSIQVQVYYPYEGNTLKEFFFKT